MPRDHWLEAWEKAAIVDFARQYPLEDYRRLAFTMLDRDIVAVSPASVYRVLRQAGLIRGCTQHTRKGTGSVQPLQPHEHWHVDFSYVNEAGAFCYLCSILDGCSRFIVQWENGVADQRCLTPFSKALTISFTLPFQALLIPA